MKLKKLLVIVLTLAMVAGLAACGSSGGGQTTGGKDTKEAAANNGDTKKADDAAEGNAVGETQDVVMWYYWENESHQKALNEMLDKYNASQSTYKMTAKYVPFADFKKQLSIGASARRTARPGASGFSGSRKSYAVYGIYLQI